MPAARHHDLAAGPAVARTTWSDAAGRAVHPSARGEDEDVLTAIAAGLAAVTVPWELRGSGAPTERSCERLLATPAYDAWVVCWPATPDLVVRDYDQVDAPLAIAVVSGRLELVLGDGGDRRVRQLALGDAIRFDAADLHAVANVGGTLATIVQVIAAPGSPLGYRAAAPSSAERDVPLAPCAWDRSRPAA